MWQYLSLHTRTLELETNVGVSPNHMKLAKAYESDFTVTVPVLNAPPNTIVPTFELLNTLDSWFRPGLTPTEFHHLIAQCHRCNLVMTQRVFNAHECARSAEDTEIEWMEDQGNAESPVNYVDE